MSGKKENIDNFVKKVVEHYDVQYDESHWEMLESRLDEEMPLAGASTSGVPITSIIISVISGMVLMLGILWISGVFESHPASDSQVTFEHQLDKPLAAETKLSDEVKSHQDMEENQSIKAVDASKPISLVTLPPSFTRQGLSSDLTDQAQTAPVASRENRTDTRDPEYHETLPDINLPPESKSFLPWSLSEDLDRLMISGEKVTNTIIIPEMQKESPLRWGVAASFAPDFNSVGIEASRQVSKQLGLQLFATYKNRLTLSSGVLYNKKRYTTAGETYHPPSGYWIRQTNGVVPDEVFGHCAVVDVPVNLTFNWRPNHRLQLLTGFGISNYFVLSEDYSYRFDGGNPGAATGWDTDEMTSVLFGVGNVSVGVMYFIKPKVAIKVEPYLKLPFKDIGWGQVNLYSTGTLISVQYSFN